MTNAYYTSPTDVEAGVKVRSVDLNTLDASVDSAFDKLPTENNLKRGTTNYAVDTGTANAYVVSLPHTPSGYVDGLTVRFRAINTNTGASTINVNSLGAKSIRNRSGSALAAGDITVGVPLEVIYSTATGYFHLSENSAVSATAAASSATAAASSASAASTSASAAASSATAAASSASAASTSETNAASSASSASTSASTATTQASNASTSATNAASSATTATTKASEASTSATNAATSATNAATSATNAATSATNAASSATTASEWATKTTGAVSGSEYSAKYHAQQAATSATNAASSASAASTSATNAASSESAASTSATNAASSATTATTKASEASTSATNAASSATTATTKASEASTSATNASNSASAASTSATNASNSASAAATSATNASNSATAAATSETNAANYAAALVGTSTTSLAIGTGSKTFTTQSGKQFNVGQWLTATSAADSANYMFGQVTAYSGTSLTVNVTAIGGSGTLADWNLSIAGIQGATGATGPAGSADGVALGATSTNPTASGTSATGLGHKAAAGSNYSTAIGSTSGNAGSTTATGAGAVAINGYASGTDSFAAAIADNTSSYGAAGNNSVALGYRAKASGTLVAIAVGHTALASGANSIALGRLVTASAQASIAVGYGATAAQYGKFAYTGVGSANQQAGMFVMAKDTADATPAVITTDTGAASTTNQVILPNNSTYRFRAEITAMQSAAQGTGAAGYVITGLIRRGANAAATSLLASSKTVDYESDATWDVAVSADTTNGGLAITVTGVAATNIRWVAVVDTAEVTYA